MKPHRWRAGLLLLALSVTASACDAIADPDVSQRTVVVPDGWSVNTPTTSGQPADPGLYTGGVDRATPRQGVTSAFLSGTSSTSATFANLYQMVRADNYRGKRVLWSGWIRSWNIAPFRGPPAGGGGLWARVDGYTQSMGLASMLGYGTALWGTSGWQQVGIVLDIPSNAAVITVGALLSGSGDLLIDDLRLEIIGVDQNPGASYPFRPDSANVAANYAQARLEPVNLGFEGLSPAALQP